MKAYMYMSIYLFIVAIVCASCGGSNSSGTTSNPNIISPTPSSIGDVQISQSSMMPTNGNNGQNYQLTIYNNSTENISLSSASAIGNTYNAGQNINGVKTSLYDLSSCTANLAPQATCNVQITPQGATGGFILATNFLGITSNKTYTAQQLVEYGSVSPSNGFSVSSTNLTVVKTPQQVYYVSIPFILANNYSSINVSSSVTPTYQNIICNANLYTAGNSCTAQLAFKGGNYTNTITFTGTPISNLDSFSLQSTNISDTVASINLTSISNNVANLINNGFNAVISSSSGGFPISLMNNGLANTTISSITSTQFNSFSSVI